jgi:cobalt-zinc-cadmium efflux system outer membrane protein
MSGHEPGSVRSSLGPIPGAGVNVFGQTPGTDAGFLGGRPGPSFPRVPSSIGTPGGGAGAPTPGIVAPARLRITNVPPYGPLDIPETTEDEGPSDGLTLDQAIERLVRDNLALQVLRWQIPAARADVLTASLRANPILYADSQLVPYGRYNRDHPGGPLQYDLNVNHPVDYSGKRRARTAVAEVLVTVQEARFQDAARIQIDNLYIVFVDVLAARETLRFAEASRAGLERLLSIHETLYRESDVTRADVGRIRSMLDAAQIATVDAEETLRRTKRSLGNLLNLPPAQSETIQVRGTIGDHAPAPPASSELARIALASRPDLLAQRLGVRRAEADVRVARASRFADAHLLYQPYTFQDLSPAGLKSATSWALGGTVPLPIYNRNQGGVARSLVNVRQTVDELAALEHRIATEVRDSERRYISTDVTLRATRAEILPAARRMRDDTLELFTKGELTAVEAAEAQKEYNQIVRAYRDTLIRHRRSMLALNTVLGRRILP